MRVLVRRLGDGHTRTDPGQPLQMLSDVQWRQTRHGSHGHFGHGQWPCLAFSRWHNGQNLET